MDSVYDVSSIGTVRNRKTCRIMKLSKNTDGYLHWTCCHNGPQETIKVHRAVALAFLENPEDYPTVDHRNRVRNDNRVENLQWASLSMQMRNKAAYGASGFKGVIKQGEKYKAKININGQNVHIGTYDTAEQAGAAYAARFTQEGFDIPE